MIQACYCGKNDKKIDIYQQFKCLNCQKSQHKKCYDMQLKEHYCFECRFFISEPWFLQQRRIGEHKVFHELNLDSYEFNFDLEKNQLKKQYVLIFSLFKPSAEAKNKNLNHILFEFPNAIYNSYQNMNQQRYKIWINKKEVLQFQQKCGYVVFNEASDFQSKLLDQNKIIINCQKSDIENKGSFICMLFQVKQRSVLELLEEISKQKYDQQLYKDGQQMFMPVDFYMTKKMIEIPCRGKSCSHYQCFDLTPYLDMKFSCNSSDFNCPVCSKKFNWNHLYIDEHQMKLIQEIKDYGFNIEDNYYVDEFGKIKFNNDLQILPKQNTKKPNLERINMKKEFIEEQDHTIIIDNNQQNVEMEIEPEQTCQNQEKTYLNQEKTLLNQQQSCQNQLIDLEKQDNFNNNYQYQNNYNSHQYYQNNYNQQSNFSKFKNGQKFQMKEKRFKQDKDRKINKFRFQEQDNNFQQIQIFDNQHKQNENFENVKQIIIKIDGDFQTVFQKLYESQQLIQNIGKKSMIEIIKQLDLLQCLNQHDYLFTLKQNAQIQNLKLEQICQKQLESPSISKLICLIYFYLWPSDILEKKTYKISELLVIIFDDCDKQNISFLLEQALLISYLIYQDQKEPEDKKNIQYIFGQILNKILLFKDSVNIDIIIKIISILRSNISDLYFPQSLTRFNYKEQIQGLSDFTSQLLKKKQHIIEFFKKLYLFEQIKNENEKILANYFIYYINLIKNQMKIDHPVIYIIQEMSTNLLDYVTQYDIQTQNIEQFI